MFTFDFVVHTQVSEFVKLARHLPSRNIEAQLHGPVLTHAPTSNEFFKPPVLTTKALNFQLHFHFLQVVSSSFDFKSATGSMERSEKEVLCVNIECTHFNFFLYRCFLFSCSQRTEKFLFYQTQQDSVDV